MKFKRGQVTIFVIIAILLVASIVGFFLIRDSISSSGVPPTFEPVYTTFLSCLEEDLSVGINVLGSQGGYINLPEFSAGSTYSPFSSELNFVGSRIPYWYYVSGNNLAREQVPTKSFMEEELASFVESRIQECSFEGYYDDGFSVNLRDASAEVQINDKDVEIVLDMQMDISRGEEFFSLNNHQLSLKSSLGELYDSALEIYEEEQETLFLENYGLDTIRRYAPVDGVELTCAPKVWNAQEIYEELLEAVEANTQALKVKDGDFDLAKEENKYFILDLNVDKDVRFLNSRDWSNSFEVNPSSGAILMAEPVGDEPGMGVLGFCYAPYHFVYSLKYPVLVQIFDGLEMFQFPMAVVIEGNKPREALEVQRFDSDQAIDICELKDALINVNVYDKELNPIEAEVSYKCFGQVCNIGSTSKIGKMNAKFPQCVNGQLIVTADGFRDGKYLLSTNDIEEVDVVLDKEYEMQLELTLGGARVTDRAILNFVSNASSQTIIYPEQKSLNLSEGQYKIQMYVYRNSSIKFPETKYEQCVDVPQEGIGGVFGLTTEECFDVTIPSQTISNVLIGGGKENYYILEDDLKNNEILNINANKLPLPNSLETLQQNYLLFEVEELEVSFE